MKRTGLWIHWIGDAISATSIIVIFAVGYGRLQAQNEERDRIAAQLATQLAAQTVKADAERRELKQDIQAQLQNITGTLNGLDNKLTAIMLDNSRGKR